MCCIYFDPVFKTVLLKRIFENVVSFWRSRSNFQLAPGWGALDPAPGAKGAFIICLKMAYRFVKYCRRKKFVLKSLVWGLKFKVYLFSLSCRFWVEQEPKPVLQSTLGSDSSQKRPAPAPLRKGQLRLRCALFYPLSKHCVYKENNSMFSNLCPLTLFKVHFWNK